MGTNESVRIWTDFENNAESWYDLARLRTDCPRRLVSLISVGGETVVNCEISKDELLKILDWIELVESESGCDSPIIVESTL